jgi:hypothetical protein
MGKIHKKNVKGTKTKHKKRIALLRYDRKTNEKKKSDAQVGRVNTFHTLQTIRKGPLNYKLCMKRSLRFSNF